MIRTINHPVRGEWEMLGPPIHLSDSDVEMVPAPLLGQHTDEVLGAELRLSRSDIDQLAASGVIGAPRQPAATT
jgi:formyl-CoA transferase